VRPKFSPIYLLLLIWLLTACRPDPPPTLLPLASPPPGQPEIAATAVDPATPATAGTPTATVILPTPTPALAALVNGQPILLAVYEKELARYEQAQLELGFENSPPDYRSAVLNHLIDHLLIAQAAAERNIVVSPAEVEQRLAEMQALTGGSENFVAWIAANQWSEEEFRQALLTEMINERVAAQVTADVPYAVEQVRARYIQVEDAVLAQSILEQARAGANFAFLAQTHSLDRVTGQNGGDLSYFARGSLLAPEMEAVAFALEVGQISDIIAVSNGNGRTTYYLVQLLERNPQMPLSSSARAALLEETFDAWLAEQWARAEIIRFIETGP
jgi:foldase protein PrsA